MINQTLIAASILSADFSRLGEECQAVLAAGADVIHFDVMDHHYVPNLTMGAVVCQSLRRAGITAPIDVHLMVTDPAAHLDAFAAAGASCITFHPETVDDIPKMLQKIRDLDLQAGLAVNPDQSLDLVQPFLADIDLLLLMSVFPGFGGQAFIPDSLTKVATAVELIRSTQSQARLGIDGGVKVDNIGAIVGAGADFCVLGSGIFAAQDYTECLRAIRKAIKAQ